MFEYRNDGLGIADFNLDALQSTVSLIRDTQKIENDLGEIEKNISALAQVCEPNTAAATTAKGPVMIGMVANLHRENENDPSRFKAVIIGNPAANSKNEIATLLQTAVKNVTGGTVTAAADEKSPDAFIITISGVTPEAVKANDQKIREALHQLKNIPTQSAAPTSGLLLDTSPDISLANLGTLNIAGPRKASMPALPVDITRLS